MAATGWLYTTPYDPEPEVALQRLREETFLAGDYSRPGEALRLAHVGALLRGASPWFRGMTLLLLTASQVSAALRRFLASGRGPRTIDEALAMSGEDGTHSILDISHTAEIPEFGAATPLSRKVLLEHFGTTRPTRSQVDALGEPDARVRRWEAAYFVVYDEAGGPAEYVFFGASGD